MSAPEAFCIASNQDVSGVGVRVAIYAQNLLSFVPALWALKDKKITKNELESLEVQSTGILITAFAILISTIVQSATKTPLSNFHTTIILNLSWMSNTNTFTYFPLCLYYKLYKLRSESKAEKTNPRDLRQWSKLLWKSSRNSVVAIGSLHLTLMAAVGIWFWHQPATFGKSPPCSMSATLLIVGRPVPFASTGLQTWSILIYSLLLIPGINLILPACFFFAPFYIQHRWFPHLTKGYGRTIPVVSGLAVLLLIDVILLIDIEVTIKANPPPFLESDGSVWTFGQTLALLVLMIPLRDLIESLLQRRSRTLGKHILRYLEEGKNDAVMSAVKWGADIEYKDRSSGDTPLIRAARKGNLDIVKVLTKHNANHNAKDHRRKTSLLLAAEGGHWEVVRHLVSVPDVDINSKGDGERTPILLAAASGNLEIVKHLASLPGININLRDYQGRTPLHLAAESQHSEVVRYLASLPTRRPYASVDF